MDRHMSRRPVQGLKMPVSASRMLPLYTPALAALKAARELWGMQKRKVSINAGRC